MNVEITIRYRDDEDVEGKWRTIIEKFCGNCLSSSCYSVIVVDTLETDVRAEKLKKFIADITEKPVKTIIYTHGHPDHRGGAGVFSDTAQEVIAFAPMKPVLGRTDELNDVLNKRGSYQLKTLRSSPI